MIGSIIDRLSFEEESRVLCTVMRPGSYTKIHIDSNSGPCLVGTIINYDGVDFKGITPKVRARFDFKRIRSLSTPISQSAEPERGNCSYQSRYSRHAENQYDALCKRFGTTQINNMIRNRILTNRIVRALTTTINYCETVS